MNQRRCWGAIVILSVHFSFVAGCSSQDGKVTKQNVLRVQTGMSVSDAKMILGPPTHESKVLNSLEWGKPGPDPWIVIEYNPDTLVITRKNVIGAEKLPE